MGQRHIQHHRERPSSWAAELISHADVYGITMLADGSYQSAITRKALARLAANTARTLGLVEDVSDPVAVVQQLGVMQPNADGSFDTTSRGHAPDGRDGAAASSAAVERGL